MGGFDHLISPVWSKIEGKRLPFVLIGAEKSFKWLSKKVILVGRGSRNLVVIQWNFFPIDFCLKETENVQGDNYKYLWYAN